MIISATKKDDRKVISINLSYIRKKGEQLTNFLIRKPGRSFEENFKFKTVHKTNKLSMFWNTKDSISVEQKSNFIYRIICPGCFQKYAAKTETLSPELTNMVQKLRAFIDHIMLFTLWDAATNTTIVNKELHLHNAVISNVKILDKND